MAAVQVQVNGRSYTVGCEDGQEAHVEALARGFDAQVREVGRDVGQLGDVRLFLMAALLSADELGDVRARLAQAQGELARLQSDHARAEARAAQALDLAARRVDALTDGLASPPGVEGDPKAPGAPGVISPFPVAATAEAALHAPVGAAHREREARAAAHGPVAFVTEWVGPAFPSREAAACAYSVLAEAPWCALRPIAREGETPRPPAAPTALHGARWPSAEVVSPAQWRLSVTYWKTRPPGMEEAPELDAARKLRRDPAAGDGLDPHTLRRLAEQPLRAVRPQQPLDIGLFEIRLPERPDIVVPDE